MAGAGLEGAASRQGLVRAVTLAQGALLSSCRIIKAVLSTFSGQEDPTKKEGDDDDEACIPSNEAVLSDTIAPRQPPQTMSSFTPLNSPLEHRAAGRRRKKTSPPRRRGKRNIARPKGL